MDSMEYDVKRTQPDTNTELARHAAVLILGPRKALVCNLSIFLMRQISWAYLISW